MKRLTDKVAIVTGAARGIGAATARQMIAEGARVVVADVLEAEAAELAAELDASAIHQHHDVTDADSWRATVEAAERRFGGVDILVNNAGVLTTAALLDTTADEVRRVLNVNAVGALLGMQAVGPSMQRAGGGAIINISSIAGMKGLPNLVAYCASKWALRGMTKVAALEFGSHGIRVNSVHPGVISTAMAPADAPVNAPLGRRGRPEEVALLVCYLASDEASYTTGAEHVIDAGMTAG